MSTILVGFAGIVLVTAVAGVLLVWLWPDAVWRSLIALAVPLLVGAGLVRLNLALAQSRLQPRRYGVMATVKTVSALALGALMILWVSAPMVH